MDFRDASEFDPKTYSGQGGLLGRLMAMMQQSQIQPNGYPGLFLNSGPQYNSDSYSPQGGLPDRLLTRQVEQSQYQPVAEPDGGAQSRSQNLDVRKLSLASVVAPGLAKNVLSNGGSSFNVPENYRDHPTRVLGQGSGPEDGQQICRLMAPAAAFKMCLYLCPNGDVRRLPIDNRNLGCPPFILGSHGFGPEQ